MNSNEKLEKFFIKGEKLIKKILNDKKIGVFYHKDLDGIASAILTKTFFKNFGKKVMLFGLKAEDRKKILKILERVDSAIILDLPIDFLIHDIESLQKKVLIIDHHPPKIFVENESLIHLNPHFAKKDAYQPTSYLTYKLFSRMTNLKNKEFLAVLGTVADYGFENCKDLLRKWIKVKKKEDLMKTKIGKSIPKIYSAINFLEENYVLNLLSRSKNLGEIVKNKKVNLAHKKFKKIYREALAEFEKNKEEYKNLNLIISYLTKKEISLSSYFANEISTKKFKTTVLIFEELNGKIKVSARLQKGKLDLGNLMEKCSKSFNGGGGHKNAAAATIKKKYYEDFKACILNEFWKHRNSTLKRKV